MQQLMRVTALSMSSRGVGTVVTDIAAASPLEALTIARARGLHPLRAVAHRPPWHWKFVLPRVRRRGVGLLMHLASALESTGRTNAAAVLREIIDQRPPAERVALAQVKALLESGSGFIDAVKQIGAFDNATIAILRAGELAGRLPRAIRFARDQTRARFDLLLENLVLAGAAAGQLAVTIPSLAFTQFVMLPKALELDMPLPPEAAESFARSLAVASALNYAMLSLYVGAGLAGVAITILLPRSMSFPERPWARRVQRLPGIRGVLRNQAFSTGWNMLNQLTDETNISIGDAVDTIRRECWVAEVRAYWSEVHRALAASEPRDALARAELSDNERFIISSARTVRQLGEASLELAKYADAAATRCRALVRRGLWVALILSTLASLAIIAIPGLRFVSAVGESWATIRASVLRL